MHILRVTRESEHNMNGGLGIHLPDSGRKRQRHKCLQDWENNAMW